jgi:hypothetical protein
VRRALARTFLLAAASTGCVYYNAMWSAERLARDARRFEARGQEAEARLAWARAGEKAESVAVHHPRSRWADEARVLQGEGQAGSGDCGRAVPVLAKATGNFTAPALRERALLATAACALEAGDAAALVRAATPLLESRDPGRRSTAALLLGQGALARGDPAGAAALLARSDRTAAAPLRVRALIAAGLVDSALAMLGARKGRGAFVESDWTPVFDALAGAAGAGAASRGLATFLAGRRIPAGARARLLLADGDRLRAAGALDSAGARYAQVARLVPDSVESGRARVHALLLRAAGAGRLEDLEAVSVALAQLDQTGGAAGAEARVPLRLLQRMAVPGASDAERFRSAEIARDSLGAPHLAGLIYVDLARRFPASVFAPKALVAALPLLPGATDSLVAVLDAAYRTSPYTRALHGEESPGFTAAEDSLALALGLRPAATVSAAVRVAAPVPGPRGPRLDPEVAAAPAVRAAPRARAVDRPDRPKDPS